MKKVFVAPFGLGQKTTVWARILPLAKVVASDAPRLSTRPITQSDTQSGRFQDRSASHLEESTSSPVLEDISLRTGTPQSVQVHILIPPWDTPEDAGKCWVDEGVTITHVQLRGGLLWICWRLLRAIWAIRPDVVHIVKPRAHAGIIQWLLWVSRRFRARQNRPHILLDIDDWEQAWNEVNDHNWLVGRFLAWQEEWGIRHADGITAASRWLVDRASGYAPSTPLLYLPNGVLKPKPLKRSNHKATLFEEQAKKCTEYLQILYLTRYVEVSPKWLADFWYSLLSALSDNQLGLSEPDASQNREVRLIVAGGPLQQNQDVAFRQAFEQELSILAESEEMFSKYRSAKNAVEWLGLVDKEMIDRLYATATCAIFPAAEVPLQQAKCSVRMATTLLHGLPTVASAVGQQAEYGANGAAYLVSANATPTEFSKAVYQVLDNPKKQAAMSKRASNQLLENYSWDKLGRSLIEFYQKFVL